MTTDEKKLEIKTRVQHMLDESYHDMLNKIDKVLNSGAIDVAAWDPKSEPMIVPRIIVTALMESESGEWAAKGTSYEKRIRKGANNIKCFV